VDAHQLQPAPVEASLEIADAQKSLAGFSLKLRGNRALAYSISDRSSRGIALEFAGVKAYENAGSKVEGLSVIQLPDRTLVELNLDREADIELYTDAGDQGDEFALVIEATYRKPVEANVALQLGSVPSSYAVELHHAAVESATASALEPIALPAHPQAAPSGMPASQLSAPSDVPVATPRVLASADLPLRVTRGLTAEQQDRNISQTAITLTQSGRLLEAYESLLTFLARNREAHLSRETLGTILLAQREYAQAALVIDEGLQLAPNYAPYKKIKARLLMQEGRSLEALQVLQQLPPTLQEDQEYHELLATLFQQAGEHGRAVATYQELLRSNGAEGRWWTGMGISLEAQGDTAKALASYQTALQQSQLDAGIRQYSQARVRALSEQ
jgi:tetratricopeptide (TPR) repeat protein